MVKHHNHGKDFTQLTTCMHASLLIRVNYFNRQISVLIMFILQQKWILIHSENSLERKRRGGRNAGPMSHPDPAPGS